LGGWGAAWLLQPIRCLLLLLLYGRRLLWLRCSLLLQVGRREVRR
jgi:hypothetical protein